MSDVKLGSTIDASQQRDAIHIAVAPVIATQILAPGDHIGFLSGSTEEVAGTAKTINPIGIVDPFMKTYVQVGERFWMFLYPQTITSLRHDWTHPAFEAAAKVDDPVAQSRKWIESFAADLDQTYNRLMEAADRWVDDDDYTYDNSETYKNVDYAKWPIFWSHYEIVTGRKVKDRESAFFTCSC